MTPGGVEVVYAPGGFEVERGAPYIPSERGYELVVRDCGVGTRTPMFLEETEEEEEEEMAQTYIPEAHLATPTPSSSTTAQLPPAKKKRKRGKRAKGRSETAPDPSAPTPPPTPQEVARRHAQAKRAFQARRARASATSSTPPPPSQPSAPPATAAAIPQAAVTRAPAKDRLGPRRKLQRDFSRQLRPAERAGIAAAAALEAAEPGRKERTMEIRKEGWKA